MKNYSANLIKEWKLFISEKTLSVTFILSLLVLVLLLICYSNFLLFVESREGLIFSDPVLSIIGPVNLTYIIFGFLYLSLLVSIIYFTFNPGIFLLAIIAYSFLVVFRIASLYIFPLEPPDTMILLKDPLVEYFGTGKTLTKDLFFSGHTSLIFLLYLVNESRWLKNILLAVTIAVGASVILQHVHYTIDVVAAPVFSFISVRLAKNLIGLITK